LTVLISINSPSRSSGVSAGVSFPGVTLPVLLRIYGSVTLRFVGGIVPAPIAVGDAKPSLPSKLPSSTPKAVPSILSKDGLTSFPLPILAPRNLNTFFHLDPFVIGPEGVLGPETEWVLSAGEGRGETGGARWMDASGESGWWMGGEAKADMVIGG
jgi:hypothetical protein